MNQLHITDIKKFGIHPRTMLRNQVTHFDECGLVLVGTDPRARSIVTALQSHQWQDALLAARDDWQKVIHPIIFGHANLEMLLNPFLGLTGKWLYIESDSVEFTDSLLPSKPAMEILDNILCQHISDHKIFAAKGNLKPLPLLGIPRWHQHQDMSFYHQADYFRPLAKNR